MSLPICRTLFFHTQPQAKYLFLFLDFFVYKVDPKLGPVLILRFSQKGHLMMQSKQERLKTLLRAIKYLFPTCPSDNYLFHGNLVENLYLYH